jgi:tetratricopeptide (TPR) repeat protein
MRFLPALRLAGAIALATAFAACAPMPSTDAAKAAPAPSAEETLRARAQEQLATGLKLYESGDYEGAQKNLSASLDHGLLSKSDQSVARKHLAFVHCLASRETQCADEFRKAFEIDPAFALSPAEDGHPIWGPVYRNVRTQVIAAREAAQGKPRAPLTKAEQLLANGMLKYDAGEFPDALKLLEEATKEGLKEKSDQVKAMKHTAFCLCLMNRYPACRAQFVKIYDVDPDFDLSPAEAGHPSWTKTFAAAKAQAKRAHDEKAKKKAP